MESKNNASEHGGRRPTADLDVHRVIQQHLRALTAIGMQTIPHGTGQTRFQWQAPASSEVVATADSVHESSPNWQAAAAEATGTVVVSTTAKPPLPPPAAPVGPTTESRAAKPRNDVAPSFPAAESLSLQQRQQRLEVLQQQVAACTLCPELASSRTQTVFGVGNVTPRLVFVGEAPGAEEDKAGQPFVGAAGQLLNKILAASKIKRDDVYILNTVKCRPPGNRIPAQQELDHCWTFAQQQLAILQPEFICCLGSVAAKRILNTTLSLGKLRQKFHPLGNSQVVVTYHPAYLLRTESAKRFVWDDMKMLIKAMGISLE